MPRKPDVPDYSEFTDLVPARSVGDNTMARLYGLAQDQLDAEQRVAQADAELKAAEEALKDIADRRFPELLDELQLPDFTNADGVKVAVKTDIKSFFPKEGAEKALAWLTEQGMQGLVKRKITLELPAGDEAGERAAVAALRGAGFEPKVAYDAHWMTLTSALKEQMEKGVDVPLTLFNGIIRRFTKVTLPKAKKSRRSSTPF